PALALQLREAGAVIVPSARALVAALGERAREHVRTLCVGRTHGMHAEPTTFGIKLAGFAFEMHRNAQRLERAFAGTAVGALSGAVEEPVGGGQKGSSAMPHKRNPIKSEQVCGLARVLRGNAQAALEDVALWHERDISHSSVERVILPDCTILLDYSQHVMLALVQGMTIDGERMRENL